MSQENLITMKCTQCEEINYVSSRNKRTHEGRLSLKKHCRRCRSHTEHQEGKRFMKK